jgi:hypothetical protein
MLLFEALARNLLCDLAACLHLQGDTWDKESWSDNEKLTMKTNIVRLMEAAGDLVISQVLGQISIEDFDGRRVPIRHLLPQ